MNKQIAAELGVAEIARSSWYHARRLQNPSMMLSLDLRSIFLLDSHYSASFLYPLLKDSL